MSKHLTEQSAIRSLTSYPHTHPSSQKNEQRPLGLSVVGSVPWGTHFCQFYHTKKDLLDILLAYFEAGLRGKEKCIWVTSEFLNTDDARSAVLAKIPDAAKYLATGQLEIFPHTEWYLKGGIFEMKRVLRDWQKKYAQARRDGYAGVRVSGNPFWIHNAKDWKDFSAYEKEINTVIAPYRMIVLCTYSLETCSANMVIDVVSSHEFALIKRNGRWKTIKSIGHRKLEDALSKSKQELVRSNDLLLSILNHTPSAIYIAEGLDQKALLINRRFTEEFGYTIRDVPTARHWFRLAYPDRTYREPIVKEWKRRIAIAAKTGKPIVPMTAIARCKDGTSKYVQWSYTGTGNRNISYGLNVTSCIAAQEALSVSKRKFKAIFDKSPVGTVVLDLSGKILMSNITARRMSRYETVKEATGVSILDLVLPEYRQTVSEGFKTILRTGYATNMEIVLHGAVGRTFSCLLSGVLLNGMNRKPESVLIMLQDITERKRAEAELIMKERLFRKKANQLQVILDSAPALIWIATDRDSTEIIGNAAAYRFTRVHTGVNMSKSAPSSNQLAHYRLEENGRELAPQNMPIQRVASSGRALVDYEFDFVFDTGERKTLAGNVMPVFDSANQPAGAVGAFIDISDRKLIERRKDEFISIASHELKTPLTSIRAYTELMKRRSAKNGQYRADGIYERVDEQIENLVRLINDMLDSSRIQSGNLVLRTKRFDLDSMIAEVIRDVETFTNSGGSVTGRPFRFVFTEKAGCSVVGDRYRLAQVVTNLLTNAIKYSDTSRTITIMTRKTGSGVQVCVRDNGIGIPADKLNHIFERFYRVSENSGLQGRFTSLGLGLYISVNIIRQHGGVMNVKSRLGEGSEFSFYLPLRRQHNAQRTGRVRHAGSAIVHP